MLGAGARAALAGTRFTDVRLVAETGSTNRDAADLARDGASEGVVVVADHQSAGRGRRGRTWEAPPGSSLLASVLLRPAPEVRPLGLVTMAVAVAAGDACADVAGFLPALKWPNDLVVTTPGPERKLAGILAEAVTEEGAVRAVVVGMGLNVNWPAGLPSELASRAVAVNHLVGHDVDRGALLVSWLRSLDRLYGEISLPLGRQLMRDRYRSRCITIGRPVRVEAEGEAFEGDAVDITAEGHLVVEAGEEGRRVVSAADVVHLR